MTTLISIVKCHPQTDILKNVLKSKLGFGLSKDATSLL